MQYQIDGTTMQILEISLDNGESIFTESGGMSWMQGNIDMKTNTRGGLLSGLGRSLAGESLFMTTYTSRQNGAKISFGPEAPGKVVPLKLGPNSSVICQKDAFMCAEDTVTLKIEFHRKLGAGLFGGEGFILQRVSGPGMAFLEIPGEMKVVDLAAGEELKVDPGYLAAFEPTVSYDITMVKGLKNIFFSGEGLFLASLKGPGRVWLQTLPLSNLAAKLARYIPKSS
jgi:uncharacterized protein (TIGR00266 family)